MGVIAADPAARQQHMAKLRRAKRVAKRKNKEEEEQFLNITAMMDMMTIILVFLIKSYASSTDIKRAAIESGMKTLRMSGIAKIAEGLTTIEEVLRITMPD